MFRYASVMFLACIAFLCRGDGSEPKQRQFGTGWQRAGEAYVRKTEAWFVHSGGRSDFSECEVPLETGEKIHLYEYDDAIGYKMEHRKNGSLQVYTEVNGTPRRFCVKLGSNLYYDLDGDGQIDAMVDNRNDGPKYYIFAAESRIRLSDNQGHVFKYSKDTTPREVAHDGTDYTFEKGAWSKTVKPEPKKK